MDLHAIETVCVPRARDKIDYADGDAFLGGGTWLFSEPQPGVRRLIDLTALDWPDLRADDGGLEIAGTCRIAALHAFAAPKTWRAADLIPACCDALLGSFKIWNAATVGGNICLALPAGPMTALATALDGTAVIWTRRGERRQAVRDVVTGERRTSLAAGEILRAVLLPEAALRRRAAFRQQALSPAGRSAALLIGTSSGGDLALTITAATPRPVRLDFQCPPTDAAFAAAIEAGTAACGWFDDAHGAPDWRRHLTHRLAREIRDELACV